MGTDDTLVYAIECRYIPPLQRDNGTPNAHLPLLIYASRSPILLFLNSLAFWWKKRSGSLDGAHKHCGNVRFQSDLCDDDSCVTIQQHQLFFSYARMRLNPPFVICHPAVPFAELIYMPMPLMLRRISNQFRAKACKICIGSKLKSAHDENLAYGGIRHFHFELLIAQLLIQYINNTRSSTCNNIFFTDDACSYRSQSVQIIIVVRLHYEGVRWKKNNRFCP